MEAVVALRHEVQEGAVRVGVEIAHDRHLHVVLLQAVQHFSGEPGERVPELLREGLLVDGDEVGAALRLHGEEELFRGVGVPEEHLVRVHDGNVEPADGLYVNNSHSILPF